jgi:hypothetical protein
VPLKEQDLKDTDTYKKASRLDLPKITAGNVKFWIYQNVELPNASGKKQKYPAFLALVDDTAIRKALTGKKVICKGTCTVKEERIAFEPTTGKVPYKALKVSVPLLLGKQVWIPAGMEEDDGDDSATADAPVDQTAADTSAAALTGAWNKLVKDAQAYAAAHPERKEALSREMGAIAALLKANQAAEAKPKIEHLQATLDGPAAVTHEATPANAGQLGARWNALVKQMQADVAAHPEKRAALSAAAAGVPELIKSGKLDAAAKQMDSLESALGGNAREKEYRTRYQAVAGALAAALRDPQRDASRLRAMDAFMVEKANAGDFDSALKALQKMEEALAGAPAATSAAGPGIDYTISLLNWVKAKKQVRVELDKLEAAILKEFADEPKLPIIKSSLKKLEQVLGGFDESLRDKLDEATKAPREELPQLHKEALGILDEYQDYVDTDPFIEALETNPFLPISVREPLDRTLSEIAGQLTA